jgi:hypothetical protein
VKTPVLILAVLAAACATVETVTPPAPPKPHETFLANPTRIEATSVRLLLPAGYRDAIRLSGLSGGWMRDGEIETWEGTGACELDLLSLSVRCRELSVTLRHPSGEPEVMIQAEGEVRWSHAVRGIGSATEGVSFLMLRNDRSLER